MRIRSGKYRARVKAIRELARYGAAERRARPWAGLCARMTSSKYKNGKVPKYKEVTQHFILAI